MLILAVLAGLILGAGLTHAVTSRGVLRLRRRRPLLVTLKTGDAFKGVLTGTDRAAIVLSQVEHMGETPTPVDGELIVLLGDVKYAQRL